MRGDLRGKYLAGAVALYEGVDSCCRRGLLGIQVEMPTGQLSEILELGREVWAENKTFGGQRQINGI